MKAQGYDHLSLACFPENTEAAAFWENQGFSVTRESTNQDGHPVNVMERDI